MLDKLPRWALIAILAVSLPAGTYAITEHVRADKGQTEGIQRNHEDLEDLAATVANLVTVVEYNYKETDRNSQDVSELKDTQKRLEILLTRIEARLDKDAN